LSFLSRVCLEQLRKGWEGGGGGGGGFHGNVNLGGGWGGYHKEPGGKENCGKA